MTDPIVPPPPNPYDCPLGYSSSEIIRSLARIEESLHNVKYVIEGNGVPGLISRIRTLEAALNESRGKSTFQRTILTIVLGFGVAFFAFILNDYSSLHKAQVSFAEADAKLLLNLQSVKAQTDDIQVQLRQHDEHTHK